MTSKSRLLSSVVNKPETLVGASLNNPSEVNLQALETAATQYTDVTTLPASGYVGEQAYVASTNRLYIWTGAGWFNIALVNTDPTISSAGDANYTMSYGTPITVDVDASDPEGLGLSYSYYTSDSIGNIATITNDSSQFTITPSSDYSVEGSFGLVFRASDGPNIASSSTSTFTLTNQSPSLSGNSASYVLATDGSTPTVITLTSVDPEGQPITYTATGDSGFNSIATVSNDSSVFTITPKSEDSAVSGTGSLTFTASDGVKSTSAASSFTITFASIVTDTKYNSLLVKAETTGDNNDIVDATGTATYSLTNTPYAGSFSPYRHGGYSTYFNRFLGSNPGTPRIQVDGLSANFGTGDFTIEFWLKSDNAAWSTIVARAHNNTGGFSLFKKGNDKELYLKIGTSAQYNSQNANLRFGTWNFIQVVRDSGTIKMYRNGTQLTLDSAASNTDNISLTSAFTIGGLSNSNMAEGEYLYDLRVSTIARSASTGLNRLEVDSDTIFLACHKPYLSFDTPTSVNNKYLDTYNAEGVVTTRPDTPLDNYGYDTYTHGGSYYFNGIDESIYNDSTFICNAANSDFTIEFWVYPHAQQEDWPRFLSTAYYNDNTTGWSIGFNSTSKNVHFSATGSTQHAATTYEKLTVNTWNHIVLQRDSSFNMTIWINGKISSVYTSSGNGANWGSISGGIQKNGLFIGQERGGSNYFEGYISDVKITKGTALYNASNDLTPPTEVVTTDSKSGSGSSITGNTAHLIGNEASIVDKSQSHNIDMIGNLAVNTSTIKFANTKSIYFDGGNSVLELPAPGILLPPQSSSNFSMDWTIEGWLYRTSAAGQNSSIGDGIFTVNSYDEWDEYPANTNINGMAFSTRRLSMGQNASPIGFSSEFDADNQWHHFALVRYYDVSAGYTYVNVYKDGTSVLQLQDAAAGYLGFDNVNTSSAFGVFDKYNGAYRFFFQGYMQDLRISRRAVYTGAFTPPTVEFEG
jgi:hypothetical protein